MYSVYKHTNRENGKVYIGITGTSVEKRWQNGKGYKRSPHFNSAIEKYGWDAFDHEVVASGLTKQEACKMEQDLIEQYDSRNTGYNLSLGGESGALGIKQSEATKEKKRIKCSETWRNPELRKAQSERLTGIKRSDDTRKRMSEAAKGKMISDEQRALTSATLKAYFSDPSNRKKLSDSVDKKAVICFDTGVIYSSSHDAYRQTGIQQGNINACCRGARKRAGGLRWGFYTEQANTEVTA